MTASFRIGLMAATLIAGTLSGSSAMAQGVDGVSPRQPAAAAAAPGGLKDDFTSKKWGTGTDADSSIEYSDNALRIIVFAKDYFIWSTPNSDAYGGVHLETTVRNHGSDDTTAFGFLCHQNPTRKGDFYYLVMTPYGQYAIAKAQEGVADLFLTNNDRWATSDRIAKNASFYRLGADCGNGTLALYVDGIQIAAVKDATYREGRIGVAVWSGEKAAKNDVSFDDFVMRELR
jgi:hypothetical protein